MVVEHRLARLVQLVIRQSRYFGRAKTRFQLYLAATVANLTLVAAKAGLTGEPAPVPATAAPRSLEWSTPPPHGSGKFGPSPARIGLTDQIPLPNKGFPSGFLACRGHSGTSTQNEERPMVTTVSPFLKYSFTVGISAMESRGFYYPTDAVLGRNGRIYVPNRSIPVVVRGIRICVCDVDGGYYGTFGFRGEGDGQFMWPSSGAVDSEGLLYFSDE